MYFQLPHRIMWPQVCAAGLIRIFFTLLTHKRQTLVSSQFYFQIENLENTFKCTWWLLLTVESSPILFHLFKTFCFCFCSQNFGGSKNSVTHFSFTSAFKTRLLQSPPLVSHRSQWNPLKVFNIHQIKEFANIPNSTVEELKCSWADSYSVLHISGAVMMAASRDVCRLGSCWDWDSVCRWGRGETGGVSGNCLPFGFKQQRSVKS